MSERLTCIATEHRVIRGDRRPLPCGRPACAMRDGRPYCRDHDPDAGVLRAGRRRRRTRRALERELEALRRQLDEFRDVLAASDERLDILRASRRRWIDAARLAVPGEWNDVDQLIAAGRSFRGEHESLRAQLGTLHARAHAFFDAACNLRTFDGTESQKNAYCDASEPLEKALAEAAKELARPQQGLGGLDEALEHIRARRAG